PAPADRVQPGESSSKPSRQTALGLERDRRRDERLGGRPGQARAALDEQRPPNRGWCDARGAARRQDVRPRYKPRDQAGHSTCSVRTLALASVVEVAEEREPQGGGFL